MDNKHSASIPNKTDTPVEAVQSFVASAERSDVNSVISLYSDSPESYQLLCQNPKPVDSSKLQTMRENSDIQESKTPENSKQKKIDGPFLRVKAKSKDQRAVLEIANHIEINTYPNTRLKIVKERIMKNEGLVVVERGDFDNSITLLLAFLLVKKNESWSVFAIEPLYELGDLDKVKFAAVRPQC